MGTGQMNSGPPQSYGWKANAWEVAESWRRYLEAVQGDEQEGCIEMLRRQAETTSA